MKIGRNDPCPCGSGKKYKQCCLPNDNKDIYMLVRETVSREGYKDDVADVICNLIRYIKEKQWMGACHASSAVLYVVFSELGYDVDIFIGEVQKPGEKPFDHSWITIDGKVIDIAVIMTLMGGMPISDAIVLDKDIRTKQKYDIEYGIETGLGLGDEAKIVLNVSFGEYMDAYPEEKGGLWDVVDKVSPVNFEREYLKKKYQDVMRIYKK